MQQAVGMRFDGNSLNLSIPHFHREAITGPPPMLDMPNRAMDCPPIGPPIGPSSGVTEIKLIDQNRSKWRHIRFSELS
jgi:hypothetical protein